MRNNLSGARAEEAKKALRSNRGIGNEKVSSFGCRRCSVSQRRSAVVGAPLVRRRIRPGQAGQAAGTVTEMEWINPHSWIHIDVKGPGRQSCQLDGGRRKPERSSAAWLYQRPRCRPGTEILIEGYQAKDGSNRANGRDITFADGKKLFLGSTGTGSPDDKPEK